MMGQMWEKEKNNKAHTTTVSEYASMREVFAVHGYHMGGGCFVP